MCKEFGRGSTNSDSGGQQTAGKAKIIKIEFDAVRFNMHAELCEIQSIAQERISQEELRTRILDYLSQQQVHWSTAADIIRTCPATFSTKAEAVFTGLMPMVGWAGGVPVMRQNAVLSLQFDRQVEDDIISFAFGLLCTCPNTPFQVRAPCSPHCPPRNQ